jgi:dihydroxy-acid dehydratase
MRPPSYLIRKGVHALPCIGDGRQSGTSGSASILNAAPEAADGGGLALLRTGDRVRVDLNTRRADMLVADEEIARRRADLEAAGGYPVPESQSPWQALFREKVEPFDRGAVLRGATAHRDIAARHLPRDNH